MPVRRVFRVSRAIATCAILAVMNKADALATLKRSEPALRARGVRRAAVFGSVARGEHRPDSDIDIMVEIDPEAHITVFDYADLKDYIASLFDGPVDVVNRDSLKPYVRPNIYWTVRQHGLFQGYYYFHHFGLDRNSREQHRGHPAFQMCIDFCGKYDQQAFDPDYDTMPLSAFEPMVHRLFAREPWGPHAKLDGGYREQF